MQLSWIDLPPVWLVFHLLALGILGDIGPQIEGRLWDGFGVCVILLGIGLMVWSLAQMVRGRTTPIPRKVPQALVTGGPFRVSRNPIYLADVFVLLGAVIWSGAVLGLILVPMLMIILHNRFIRHEERVLCATFGPDYARWARKVRRWL